MQCPACQLPIDEGAWQCDGCGHLFSTDFAAVRVRLQTELQTARRSLAITVGVGVLAIAVVVYLATRRSFVVSVPLGLAVLGSIGAAIHKRSVVRDRLRELDRRHRPLATMHHGRC